MSDEFSIEVPISFGHCDPAGIVFYPNYYRWFDRCFHTYLQARGGGHRALCQRLGARGIGLMDSGARFPAPATEGDTMTLSMSIADWGAKTLRLEYIGQVDARTVVEGFEVRGMFIERDGRMRAGEMTDLRAALSDT